MGTVRAGYERGFVLTKSQDSSVPRRDFSVTSTETKVRSRERSLVLSEQTVVNRQKKTQSSTDMT